MAREGDIPRRAMADACLVLENMAASVCECVAGGGVEWRVEGGGATNEVVYVGGAFDDPKSLAWRSNKRIVIGCPFDTLPPSRGGVTCAHQKHHKPNH